MERARRARSHCSRARIIRGCLMDIVCCWVGVSPPPSSFFFSRCARFLRFLGRRIFISMDLACGKMKRRNERGMGGFHVWNERVLVKTVWSESGSFLLNGVSNKLTWFTGQLNYKIIKESIMEAFYWMKFCCWSLISQIWGNFDIKKYKSPHELNIKKCTQSILNNFV